MFSSFNISASGMTAQHFRMNIISENIANINTTGTDKNTPYRRKVPIFRQRDSFSNILAAETNKSSGVEVSGIYEDRSPFKKVYQPSHPDADKDGYVSYPNVNITTEMVDMIDASRAYEANVTALNTAKNMALKALEIGRG